ncbi:sensor histidine kinase [Salidesulfovibrio onnuriiensis]|uniref:sensor histidine kinase n=1 Tax=Salidesulfovibrio onnuriiensis TaxID=2583823 RepID=UPI00202B1F6C|nr:HAMP domain-containing sensor histidine kinase [Salidesulfovibrio onnuriiensis]
MKSDSSQSLVTGCNDEMVADGEFCFISSAERFNYVSKRIREKLADYDEYDFSPRQVRALNIFFDLSQEFRTREMFYATSLNILRIMFGLECCIYVLEDEETFSLGACSDGYGPDREKIRGWDDEFCGEKVETDTHLYFPIRCNPEYNDLLPFIPPDNIIGNFVIHKGREIFPDMKLFLGKYVNRVGYQLHNRILRARNREHLNFIRNLVEDIGHNVIVPNIYFKLYFNQLRRMITELEGIGEKMERVETVEGGACENCANRILQVHERMKSQFDEIYRHYVQTSMFLETLLRRRHFEEGRYVLEKKPCNPRTQVIEPQLERYRHRLEERGIQVDLGIGGAPPDQTIRMLMDMGLISQVFANLFSNAVKYTRDAELPDGRTGRFLSYGWKILKNHFAEGLDGIRMHVFSTGEPLRLVNPMEIFDPGFRAMDLPAESGTGHGLYFVRQVVELHRGEVGYLPYEYGNEFYFILPFELEGEPTPVFPPKYAA